MSNDNLVTLAIGVAGGIFAVLIYQQIKPKTDTVNSQLANMSFTLMSAIKTASDKGETATQLYNDLLAQEATAKK